jgi:Fe-S cluster assembly protein SufD
MTKTAKEGRDEIEIGDYLVMNAADEAAWLIELRQKAAASFGQLEFPTTRHEDWKYTNVAPIVKTVHRDASVEDGAAVLPEHLEDYLYPEAAHTHLVFVNGFFAPQLSDVSALPTGVIIGSLTHTESAVIQQQLAVHADFQSQVFTALNTANLKDGAFIHLPEGCALESPIHILWLANSPLSSTVLHPRLLLVAESGAVATVIESFAALADDTYFTNAVAEMVLHEKANISHYRLQMETEQAFHIGTTQVLQHRKSNYSSFAIALGSALSRHNLNVVLDGEHTETMLDGLYVVTGNQLADTHLSLDHARPQGSSQQLYKGILDDKARAVFNGRVKVHEGALLTDARQLNKNLLLSNNAHVDTKPELEIFADDVKCAHGATVGQLEDEELFYLRTRGLSAETARALLTYGFAEDIISKIAVASVRKELDEIVLAKLHQDLKVN